MLASISASLGFTAFCITISNGHVIPALLLLALAVVNTMIGCYEINKRNKRIEELEVRLAQIEKWIG